jgi:superfamily II DNA or RNA helicase
MEFYKKHTSNLSDAVPLQEVLDVSLKVSSEVASYRHSPYQAAVAATIASISKNFIIVIMPTGSGKTWVQGILSKYYCSKG